MHMVGWFSMPHRLLPSTSLAGLQSDQHSVLPPFCRYTERDVPLWSSFYLCHWVAHLFVLVSVSGGTKTWRSPHVHVAIN